MLCKNTNRPSGVYEFFNFSIAAIHIFFRICLVSEGEIAYMGDASSALDHFRSAGYPCKDNFNPADHFIFTLAIRPGIEDTCRDRCQVITSH